MLGLLTVKVKVYFKVASHGGVFVEFKFEFARVLILYHLLNSDGMLSVASSAAVLDGDLVSTSKVAKCFCGFAH